MGRALTDQEWSVQKPPFGWREIKYKTWSEIHFSFAEKWAIENSEGWFYRSDKHFVFELESDCMIFELWLEEGIIERENGRIANKARI